MDTTYNRYNLEADFKHSLLAGIENRHTVKGYLSDWRHFFGFLTQIGLSSALEFNSIDELKVFLAQLTPEVLQRYRAEMLEHTVPLKTINRRFSTIRKFFSFCIDQQWIEFNPARTLANVNPQAAAHSKLHKLMTEFEAELPHREPNQQKQEQILSEIKSFIALTGQ